ncbi:MAG: TatD family nuclease-associated radical SAM protein [Elusimicrobiota bacterium]|jgi:TatD DNase family protein|nr:TatD family nuclease-associated radical SAM protein [Elusimicrobiota bacterium]
MKNTIFYTLGENGYLNITNRCMMACPYCIKNKWDNKFYGNDLKLDAEPSIEQILSAIGDVKKYKEIVFCGYGDALTRLETVVEVCRVLKEKGAKIRINTAGLANKFYGKNILPRLKGLVDAISISLNGSNPKEHNEINKPAFGEESFDEILKFAKEAKNCIPEVTITAVSLPSLDVSKIEALAKNAHLNFRLRPYLQDNE